MACYGLGYTLCYGLKGVFEQVWLGQEGAPYTSAAARTVVRTLVRRAKKPIKSSLRTLEQSSRGIHEERGIGLRVPPFRPPKLTQLRCRSGGNRRCRFQFALDPPQGGKAIVNRAALPLPEDHEGAPTEQQRHDDRRKSVSERRLIGEIVNLPLEAAFVDEQG
jgi:hypothetical protein